MMLLFKRDIIFKQFLPVIEGLKELEKPKDFPVTTGLVKIYQTNWSDNKVLRIANELDLKLVKDNKKAASFEKVDRKFDVVLIYNKNDKSIMIAISKRR